MVLIDLYSVGDQIFFSHITIIDTNLNSNGTSNKTKDVQCEYSHYDQDDLKKNQNPTKVFMRKNSR